MATDELRSVVSDCLKNCNFEIKKQQLDAIDYILRGFDTLCVLPTGFGESLIYQLLPTVFKRIKTLSTEAEKQQPTTYFPKVIVLSPYLSIISDQIQSENSSKFNLKSSALDVINYGGISSGEYNLIFGTPESWLESRKWRDMLSNKFFSSNLCCIVIDEVHKVSWGKKEEPFRKIFGQLSIIRFVTPEHVPCLCLSATIDAHLTELVIESCSLLAVIFESKVAHY